MSDLVSVIIPTFNREDVLPRAIASVLGQTYKNIEIIVIDDGSADNTKSIIKKYGDKVYYIFQQNQGVSSARNNGVKHSNGKYLAFIDSDDEWLPNKLELQMSEFNYANDIGMVACKAFISSLYDGEIQLSNSHLNTVETCDFYDIFKTPYLGMPNIVILKSVFNGIQGFNEKLKTAEDIDLFLRVSVNYKVRLINKPLTRVYETENSLSTSTDSYQDNINVVNQVHEEFKELFVGHESLFSEVISGLYRDYAITLLWHKKYKDAELKLVKSMSYKFTVNSLLLYIKSKLLSLIR